MLTTADGEAAFNDRNYEKAREIWEPLADAATPRPKPGWARSMPTGLESGRTPRGPLRFTCVRPRRATRLQPIMSVRCMRRVMASPSMPRGPHHGFAEPPSRATRWASSTTR